MRCRSASAQKVPSVESGAEVGAAIAPTVRPQRRDRQLAKLAGVASTGLRELKKARTFRHIADTAARLFAERGYENVAVTDVAREAEVAEQTVYNYFPTKEQLVTDRDQQVQEW